jgi:dTDP-4-amino-4,6-dideoxygalactose transaminase
MPKRIPFIKPQFPKAEEIIQDLELIYENNYYSNNGPVYHDFREQLEQYLGQDLHCVVVANATLGLMLSIKAVFGKPDKHKKYVAVPSFTFAAGPLAIRWCGFEPVFFDIDPRDTQPSIESFKKIDATYAKQLAGVYLINSFGIGDGRIEQWEQLLKDRKLPCVIDSAPGLGSTYKDGNPIGGRGACEVFSLHATKPFGIGEGGLITTKDRRLAARLESLKNFGFDQAKATVEDGLNAKITELDCAIGLRTLSRYDETLEDRRRTYKYYESRLKNKGIDFLPRAESAAVQFASIVVPAAKRPKVLEKLAAGEVDARTYYAPPVHVSSIFENCPRTELPSTDDISARIISLPVHPNMDTKTVDYICDIINGVMAEA